MTCTSLPIAVMPVQGVWNYNDSVRWMKPAVVRWKTMTTEMLSELRMAREMLSQKAAFQARNAGGAFAPTVKTWDQYCRDVGLTKSTINRWLAGHDEKASKPHVSHNTGNLEWYTPEKYITLARQVMGDIDLDPASSATANAIVKATKFYTAEDNGLTQEWRGRVWLNPPYGSDLIQLFCDKLVAEYLDQHVTQAVVLVNNATETKWFQGLAGEAAAICLPRGRVQFWSTRKESLSPLQGQVVLYLGPNPDMFAEYFDHLGLIFRREDRQ